MSLSAVLRVHNLFFLYRVAFYTLGSLSGHLTMVTLNFVVRILCRNYNNNLPCAWHISLDTTGKILQLLNKQVNDKPHQSNIWLKQKIEELGCRLKAALQNSSRSARISSHLCSPLHC